jgi:hypothetical protein
VRSVKKAHAQEGSTETNLPKPLENRLDNVCFRLGFAPTVQPALGMILPSESPRRGGGICVTPCRSVLVKIELCGGGHAGVD